MNIIGLVKHVWYYGTTGMEGGKQLLDYKRLPKENKQQS
jgi:hypothetical protein